MRQQGERFASNGDNPVKLIPKKIINSLKQNVLYSYIRHFVLTN